MQLFYSEKRAGQIIYLEDQEARHCSQVLRKQIGDTIMVTDGLGNLFTTELTYMHKKRCELLIKNTETKNPHQPYLHMAVVPTKNIDRVEWFLEKATELGVNEISLVLSEHSERKKIRLDRLQKILIVAMKQSLNTHLPQLNDLLPFKSWIEKCQDEEGTQKFIPHCYEGEKRNLKTAYVPGSKAIVLIGPEGDFSASEVELALQQGFIPITLGENRLRTETAAISVCAFLNWMNIEE